MNAVVTLQIGWDEIAEITVPRLQKYASKVGADFVPIKEKRINNSHFYYEKWQIYDFLNFYNRIVYIDLDCLVRSDTPNLFDIVSEECVGGCDENEHCNQDPHFDLFWRALYKEERPRKVPHLNCGVLVVSRQHRELFALPEADLPEHRWADQEHFNVRLIHSGLPIHILPWQFNCMEARRNGNFDSAYIIHVSNKKDKLCDLRRFNEWYIKYEI